MSEHVKSTIGYLSNSRHLSHHRTVEYVQSLVTIHRPIKRPLRLGSERNKKAVTRKPRDAVVNLQPKFEFFGVYSLALDISNYNTIQ